MQDSPLLTDFCGITMNSPIVLLSGCVGFGEEYTRVAGFSNHDVGAVVLKGTTGDARLGNPPHRVFETPMGMLNAIGLQNPGVDKVVDDILPGLDFSETRFIANVSGSTIEEYARVTKRFDDSPIDAIEINISCPNVKEGGVQFGNDPEMSARVVAACRNQTSKPIITKLSPKDPCHRQCPGWPLRTGDQADRAAQGPRSLRSCFPPRSANHWPGRNQQRNGRDRIHDCRRFRSRRGHGIILRSADLPEDQRRDR
jgi:hypothetical protein